MTRLDEEPEEYLAKVKAVRDALYGKALSTEVSVVRKEHLQGLWSGAPLHVTVDGESKLMPIYFTPEGVNVIAPDDVMDDKPAERVGQIGTEILRSLQVKKEEMPTRCSLPMGRSSWISRRPSMI